MRGFEGRLVSRACWLGLSVFVLVGCQSDRSHESPERPEPPVAVHSEAITDVTAAAASTTASSFCYNAAGLQPLAPWPMVGACPMHRGQSPVVAAQTSARAPG